MDRLATFAVANFDYVEDHIRPVVRRYIPGPVQKKSEWGEGGLQVLGATVSACESCCPGGCAPRYGPLQRAACRSAAARLQAGGAGCILHELYCTRRTEPRALAHLASPARGPPLPQS